MVCYCFNHIIDNCPDIYVYIYAVSPLSPMSGWQSWIWRYVKLPKGTLQQNLHWSSGISQVATFDDTGGEKMCASHGWLSTNSIQFHVLVDVSQVAREQAWFWGIESCFFHICRIPRIPRNLVNLGYQPGDRVVPFRLSPNSSHG